MATQLLEPYLDNGIRSPHFFNGRILDADALLTDQVANREQHWQLGSAVGSGVAWGFEVEIENAGSVSAPPVLRVSQGVALNRAGQALELRLAPRTDDCITNGTVASSPQTLSVQLAKDADTPASNAGIFVACQVPTTDLPTVEGVFVLIVSPASGFRERAPMKSLSATGKSAGCGSRYEVEGVTFRLVACPALPSDLADTTGDGTDNPLTLQNRLAHFCYGTPELLANPNYPFAALAEYGALDSLRTAKTLDDCDVPLALIYWTGNSVKFCDMWAVRRSLTPALPAEMFPATIGQRRLAESIAQFLQFQTQIAGIPVGSRRSLAAESQFRFLPAAGYLPVGGQDFTEETFFGKSFKAQNPPLRFTLDPAFVRFLLAESWLLDPIDLKANEPAPLTLYRSGIENEPGYVLFVRQSTSKSLDIKTAPPTDTVPTETTTGRMIATVTLKSPNEETIIAGRRSIALVATDGITSYPGRLYQANKFLPDGEFFLEKVGRVSNRYTFLFDNVPQGKYSVTARAVGFAADTQTTQLQDKDVRLSFVLVPSRKGDGKPQDPDGRFFGGWIDKGIGKGKVLDKYVDWKKQKPFEKWKNLPDPPPDILTQYQLIAETLQQQYPDAPISPSDIQVFVNPDYDPKGTSKDFYAYVSMGESYVPLLLTSADNQTDKTVSLGKSGIEGLDSDMQTQLIGAGITDVSMLSAVPTNLLGETLGFNEEASGSLIKSVRDGIGAIKDSPLMIVGVSNANAKTLAQNDLGSTEKLAAADADHVAATLELDKTVATRIISDAQEIQKGRVSVTDVAGVTPEIATSLETIGVTNAGGLSRLSTNDLAVSLGISTEAAGGILSNVHGMIGLGGFHR